MNQEEIRCFGHLLFSRYPEDRHHGLKYLSLSAAGHMRISAANRGVGLVLWSRAHLGPASRCPYATFLDQEELNEMEEVAQW